MLACMYPKVTRVNVRCMPHHAVVVLSMSELLNSFEKSGKFCRYCVSCNIDLTVRDVALRPTGTNGQLLYFRQLLTPTLSYYSKNLSRKTTLTTTKPCGPETRNCVVSEFKSILWSLLCADAIIGLTVFSARVCACWNTGGGFVGPITSRSQVQNWCYICLCCCA